MQVAQALVRARQEKVLQLVREHPEFNSRQLAEAAPHQLGITRNMINQWNQKDILGYKDKYAQVLKETFDALEGPAIDCMKDLIKGRNFQAAKYVLDNKGYAAAKKIEADVNQDVTINVEVEE